MVRKQVSGVRDVLEKRFVAVKLECDPFYLLQVRPDGGMLCAPTEMSKTAEDQPVAPSLDPSIDHYLSFGMFAREDVLAGLEALVADSETKPIVKLTGVIMLEPPRDGHIPVWHVQELTIEHFVDDADGAKGLLIDLKPISVNCSVVVITAGFTVVPRDDCQDGHPPGGDEVAGDE